MLIRRSVGSLEMKQVMFAALFFMLWPGMCSWAAGFDLQAYRLQRPDGSDIHYYVDRRGGKEPQAILVIMQGSDCNSIARHPTIHEYANVAPGEAVLLVEKYGITSDLPLSGNDNRDDCPIDYQVRDTIEQRVLDYLLVISNLRSEADWWNGQLIILAGSAGTGVGEQVAALVPETRRLVIFGFGGRWQEDDMLYGIRISLGAAGLDENAQAREFEQIAGEIREMREDASPGKLASGHSHAAWASMLRFDQLAALRNVSIPVLAIQGSRDQNVSPEGARVLIKTLHDLGRENITYKEYEDLDHGFVDSGGMSRKSRVIEDIRRWLQGKP